MTNADFDMTEDEREEHFREVFFPDVPRPKKKPVPKPLPTDFYIPPGCSDEEIF